MVGRCGRKSSLSDRRENAHVNNPRGERGTSGGMTRYSSYSQDYGIDMDLQECWVDERLSLSELGANYSFITNDGGLISSVWKPDIFFVNAKEATTHDVTVPNQILQILPNGTVLFSIRYAFPRISLRLSCLMDFQLFPLDRQICDVVLRPYSHTDDKVFIFWHEENPVVFEVSFDAPEFDIINFQTHNFTRFHRTGNFSSLKLELLLERDPGYYLIHLYLPLTLTVLMSWHALWLKVEIPQARLILTVNCLFTVVTVSNGARALIPRVSYLKAADVWVTACILFVYGVILVSSMVNYMFRLKLRALGLRKVDQAIADVCHVWKHGTPSDDFLLKMNRANKQERHRNIKRSESLERNARYLFPACFLLFNIVYWPFYVLRAYAYF
ncbi:hypothetical protein HPB48_012405 [Haemaphysalis longicornis]|uniref:Uncharacterized protein n=1 Tax=Haemaphysalis longicornis TaxID=44386 RepID=A0A9J6G3J7_HAELO|nr:hypothetical protein HPB48_012405 [Haemaphysalis longicornis]